MTARAKYGHFSPDGKEYVITNVATPSPWINYIYNGRYFATISNNGGGISYFKSPLHGRITRYRINDVPPDRPGKYIYIKDLETDAFWSLTSAGSDPATRISATPSALCRSISISPRASHSWQTGSAAWMFRVAVDFILGIRSTYEGLLVDPVIPRSWKDFRAERVFRGARYFVEVENPGGAESGVAAMTVDGRPVQGRIVPISDKPECRIHVTMSPR